MFMKCTTDFLSQVTWARCEESYRNRPYSVLTIGDQNYVEDKRFFVSKPQTINKKHVNINKILVLLIAFISKMI